MVIKVNFLHGKDIVAGSVNASEAIHEHRLVKGRPLILVVDDDEDCRVLALRILELLDYSYVSVSSGEKVVELTQLYQPSLVMLDIALPDTDGLELIRRLKNNVTTAAIPVVAVTAMAMVGDRERGLSAGFNYYLTKPYDFDDLTRIVESYVACPLLTPPPEQNKTRTYT